MPIKWRMMESVRQEDKTMGFYAKLMEQKREKRSVPLKRERYEEPPITDSDVRRARIRLLRPDYAREALLASFDQLEGLK